MQERVIRKRSLADLPGGPQDCLPRSAKGNGKEGGEEVFGRPHVILLSHHIPHPALTATAFSAHSPTANKHTARSQTRRSQEVSQVEA